MKQACNFPRLHNCQTLAQPRAIESERTQMWQTFTSYLHLPRLRPCFPDRVCSANGIERGRLSFFASSSAHASVIYFSLSLRFPRISPPESWEIESRYRVTKEFLRLTSLFHYFVTIRQWEFFLHERILQGWKGIFLESFLLLSFLLRFLANFFKSWNSLFYQIYYTK